MSLENQLFKVPSYNIADINKNNLATNDDITQNRMGALKRVGRGIKNFFDIFGSLAGLTLLGDMTYSAHVWGSELAYQSHQYSHIFTGNPVTDYPFTILASYGMCKVMWLIVHDILYKGYV